MLFPGTNVFCADLENSVGVDQEFYFDTRQACWRGLHLESESRQRPAVLCQFALTLQHVDVDAGLIVDTSRVHLLRAGGNRRIARDDFGDCAAVRFDA